MLFILTDIDLPGTSGFVSKKVSADVHAKAQVCICLSYCIIEIISF